MDDSGIVIRRLGRPGDLGWVVQAHGELYAAEYGWDVEFEALVARIVAGYTAEHPVAGDERACGWIAERDGTRVGCVFCMPAAAPGLAQLRILLVDPSARGRHVGSRLVDECLAFARAAGYRRMTLWTNDPLTAARRVYLSRGFRLVDEHPHRSFGADLVGQTYELDLSGNPCEC
jgi:GNAT superfamily N-acetyltransferase